MRKPRQSVPVPPPELFCSSAPSLSARFLLHCATISFASRPRNAPPLCKSSSLTQLQGRKSEESKDQRENPEPDNDPGLRPPGQLKVMMDRRHLKDALLAQLVRNHLQDHRERFQHKDPADERQQQLLLDD